MLVAAHLASRPPPRMHVENCACSALRRNNNKAISNTQLLRIFFSGRNDGSAYGGTLHNPSHPLQPVNFHPIHLVPVPLPHNWTGAKAPAALACTHASVPARVLIGAVPSCQLIFHRLLKRYCFVGVWVCVGVCVYQSSTWRCVLGASPGLCSWSLVSSVWM